MTTLYIAGPMTGLPDHNYPAFFDVEARLRCAGYETLNSARIDEWNTLFRTWDWYMRRALELVVLADGVALLPGWQDSKGATLEVHVAEALGMRQQSVDEWLRVAS